MDDEDEVKELQLLEKMDDNEKRDTNLVLTFCGLILLLIAGLIIWFSPSAHAETHPPVSSNLPTHFAKTCLHDCRIDDKGLNLLKHFEGYSPFPYKDVAGINTIGFGHALQKGDRIIAPLLGGDAQTLLESDANAKATAVNRMVQVPLRSGQADALISFAYNLGEGKLGGSTLLKRVNAKRHASVPAEFLKWDKAGGKVMKGLQVRRRAEADLYASAD